MGNGCVEIVFLIGIDILLCRTITNVCTVATNCLCAQSSVSVAVMVIISSKDNTFVSAQTVRHSLPYIIRIILFTLHTLFYSYKSRKCDCNISLAPGDQFKVLMHVFTVHLGHVSKCASISHKILLALLENDLLKLKIKIDIGMFIIWNDCTLQPHNRKKCIQHYQISYLYTSQIQKIVSFNPWNSVLCTFC